MARLEIDWTRCEAHGLCAQVLPNVITLDEWGYPMIVQHKRSHDDDLTEQRRAVGVCPALALRVTREPTTHGQARHTRAPR